MSRDAYHIFTATAEHADVLTDFSRRTFREAFESMTAHRDLEAYIELHFTPEKTCQQLADRRSAVFIAATDAFWVGYAHLKANIPPECVKGPSPLQLYRLYVSRKHQGKGLGQELIEKCYAYANGKGFKTLWLSTWVKNTRAIDIYRRQGFKTVGNMTFWVGHDPQQDFIMEKILPEP